MDCNKYTLLMQNVDGGEARVCVCVCVCVCVRAQGIWELSVPSTQFAVSLNCSKKIKYFENIY